MPDDGFPFQREVLQPAEAQALVPELRATRNPLVWVYRYTHPATGWLLSIATHGEPGSNRLSLGGFRIAPAARTDAPGYSNDREAIGLAFTRTPSPNADPGFCATQAGVVRSHA